MPLKFLNFLKIFVVFTTQHCAVSNNMFIKTRSRTSPKVDCITYYNVCCSRYILLQSALKFEKCVHIKHDRNLRLDGLYGTNNNYAKCCVLWSYGSVTRWINYRQPFRVTVSKPIWNIYSVSIRQQSSNEKRSSSYIHTLFVRLELWF